MHWNKILSGIVLGIGLTLTFSCTAVFAEENLSIADENVNQQTIDTQEVTEKNGWYQEEGYWYYYENDLYIVNSLRTLEDTRGVEGLYYFNDQGHMVTEQWIDYGNDYYFGADGKAYTGKNEINGSYYLFDENEAYLLTYFSDIIENKYYETDENGIIQFESQANSSGWIRIHDKWGLIQNDKLLREEWYQENDIWYYFDWQGTTAVGLWNLYDDKTNTTYWYYFDDNGHMLTNQWLENEYDKYYFGSNGRAYTGKHNINGQNYLFSENGCLQYNYTGIMNNTYYETNEDGIIVKEIPIEETGWIKINDRWAYVNSDGSLKQSEWYQENGVWYYFDWNYLTAIGRTSIYDDESDTYYYYHFDNNGHMLVNQWVKDEYDDYYDYYYGDNGRGYTGKHEINGVYYYFSTNAYLLKDDVEYNNNVFYVTDENGVIVNEISITSKGWIKVGNRWAFVDESGELLKSTWYEENGYTYYFDWKGLSAVGLINLYYNEDTENYYYYFDNNSRMVTNQWIQAEYENWFYFGNDGKAYTGKHTINGNNYLFGMDYPNLYENYSGIINNVFYQTNENGIIVDEIRVEGTGWLKIQDRWMYLNDDGTYKQSEWYQEDGIWYYFDWNGLTLQGINSIYSEDDNKYIYYYFDNNGHMLTNQWINDEYDTFYVGSNGKAYTGKKQIGGINYLFGNDYPYLLQNYFGLIGNTYYETNSNGVIVEEILVQGKGWIKIKDRWGYVNDDGTLKQYEWYLENGVWYYFDWDCLTATGLVEVYDINTETGYYYYFDNNGHMLVNQWVSDGYTSYYVGSNGRAYTGKQYINGQAYLFDESYPQLLTYYDGLISNVYYETDQNGRIILEQILENGWNKIKSRWAYINNDNTFKQNEWYQENDIWYYFEWNGYAAVGITNISSEYSDDYYYFDNNGHMITNYWLMINNYPSISWMYFDSTGVAAKGYQVINNKNYYFNEYGNTLTNDVIVIDGVYYATDINGQIVQTRELNQWENIAGDWYYFDNNGNPYQGFKIINGQTYYFYDNGQMATGVIYIDDYVYSFGNNGHMIKNSWWQDLSYSTNEWYYFDNEGKGYNGWLNNTYYLSDGYMFTGLQEINGKYYLFDTNGHYITNYAFTNGWNLVDGFYYYYQDNQLLYGWQLINNIWYYFDDYTGRMASQSVEDTDTGYYYFMVNGQYKKNGWQQFMNSYVYAKADGKLAYNEWQKINGTWYYFSDIMMVNENTMIDNKYHLFNSNGAWLGESNLSGWVSIDGQWKYYVNNDYMTGWQLINNKYYYFDDSGFAYSNNVYLIDNELFYFLDNCSMASTSGWIKTLYGEYVYLDSNHRVVTGWQKINNTWYYLEPLMSKGIVFIEGSYHQFAQNGAWLGKINPNDGWYKLDENYYYFRDGKLLKDEWIRSGSNYYYLKYNTGIMATEISNGYYFNNSGKLLTSQWIQLSNGKWIYVDEIGTIQYSKTLEIDGKIYNFDNNGYMI